MCICDESFFFPHFHYTLRRLCTIDGKAGSFDESNFTGMDLLFGYTVTLPCALDIVFHASSVYVFVFVDCNRFV